jgi:hypothetical protein
MRPLAALVALTAAPLAVLQPVTTGLALAGVAAVGLVYSKVQLR